MSVQVIIGDVREKLAELPDESVHCVVTSPPYFGLRDYGTASWEGGDPACEHSSVRRGHGDEKKGTSAGTSRDRIIAQDCKCGATRTDKQIGLEPTPAEFVAVMVEVFREVRRVLRKDGTCWINLGDSYANDTKWGGSTSGKHVQALQGNSGIGRQRHNTGLKTKDLIGIPWRVAFALQADGWFLRQDIIWAKPNPMPESVTDRCTKAHEYLFLLSKSARYHYDAEAIAEAVTESTVERLSQPNLENQAGSDRVPGKTNGTMTAVGSLRKTDSENGSMVPGASAHGGIHRAGTPRDAVGTRNRRSVWTVATQPFKEAHFATFPPDLIEPCILAGCPKDCCAKCGAPVVREVKASGGTIGESWHNHQDDLGRGQRGGDDGTNKAAAGWKDYRRETTGWSPSCSCDPSADLRTGAGLARGVCLDPFGGAGTTGLVADRLQRDAILIELNPEYMAMAKERITDDAPLFAVLT